MRCATVCTGDAGIEQRGCVDAPQITEGGCPEAK